VQMQAGQRRQIGHPAGQGVDDGDVLVHHFSPLGTVT
jgi:hypothetical protein